jgi:hypothetical protein
MNPTQNDDNEPIVKPFDMRDGLRKAKPVKFKRSVIRADNACKGVETLPGDFQKAVKAEAKYDRQRRKLLAMVSPDFDGVIKKLEHMWHGELHGRSAESLERCRVIGDLRRLIILAES